MIGLRVLHIATSVTAAITGDVLTHMNWLQAHGHQTALAAGGQGDLAGFEVIHYPTTTAAWWLGGRRELINQVSAWNPDLIHLHGLSALPAARALARRLHLPVLASIAHFAEPYDGRGLRDATVSWVLVPSESHRAHFIGRVGVARDQVSVLPYAVHTAACLLCDPRPADGRLMVGMVGPYDEQSGFACLLDAIARLRRDLDVRLVIADDAEPSGITEAIAAVGGREWVRNVIIQHPRDLVARSDVIVHPALDDRSAAAVVEAMACARPVVASGIGGMPELVVDGESGAIVPPGDAGTLATVLGALASDGDLRRRRGLEARAAAARFDIEVVGPAAVELYHAAICTAQNAGLKAEGSRAYRRRVTDNKSGTHAQRR